MPYARPPLTPFQKFMRSPLGGFHKPSNHESKKICKTIKSLNWESPTLLNVGKSIYCLFIYTGANTIHRTPKLVQDHRPLVLNSDNFERMCRIPKRKVCFSILPNLHYVTVLEAVLITHNGQGANFTDLPGLKKLRDGTLELDPKKMIVLSSGKHLVRTVIFYHIFSWAVCEKEVIRTVVWGDKSFFCK